MKWRSGWKVRRISGIVVFVISVITGIWLTGRPGETVRYSECVVSGEQADAIIARRREEADLIEELCFDEEALFYDEQEKTFYYSLIEGDGDACDPPVRAKGREGELKLAFREGGMTEEGIGKNETISFLAYTEEACCIYYLKCTTLPLMNIECPEEIPGEYSIPMRITLFDNGAGAAARLVCSEGEIRQRGGTARAYPKKSFRLSLRTESVGGNVRPNHVSLLGMRQDDDWLLYSAYNDQEKIRNVFSSNLWKETCAKENAQGIDFGMEYRYLELFINGRYWGLYALGYPIDEKQVCIGSDSSEAALYKHGLLGKQGDESLQFTKDGDIFGDLKESPDENMRRYSFLQRYYYDLYTHTDDNDRLRSGIDPDNAAAFYLFINLVQGDDNKSLGKNFYLLLQNGKEGGRALYAPWDLDLTWGNQYIGVLSENCTSPYAHAEDYNCIIESGYISQLLINGDAAIWNMIFEKYRALRKNGWSEENIHAMLDEYEADIYSSGAFERDMERWPEGTYGNAEDGLRVFRTYVTNRLREADLYYERLKRAYHETSNLFIRRSVQYKDFFEYCFLLEINNHDLLQDPEYAGFLEYAGVDISAVTEDIHFILANPAEGKAEYLTTLGEGEEPKETCIGRLSFTRLREGVYDVKVNGVERYHTSIFFDPEISMILLNDLKTYAFDFMDGYSMEKWKSSFDGLALYMEALSGTDYRAVVEINNPEIWQNEDYILLFEKLGITEEDIHADMDFIVWNGPEKTAFALDNFHVSGSSCEMSYGTLSLFWNELGEYGVYLNGRECFVSSPALNQNVDIRIVLLDPGTDETVDLITCSDRLR